MLTRTDNGLRFEFSEFRADPFAGSLARGLVRLMSGMWDFVAQPRGPGQIARAKLSLALLHQSVFYIEELSRATDGEAFFAASVMGCSVVESLLMLACIRHRNDVTMSKAWLAFARRRRKYGKLLHELLPRTDLADLIAIGQELGWFEDNQRVRDIFASFEGWTEGLLELPELQTTPFGAALAVRAWRVRCRDGLYRDVDATWRISRRRGPSEDQLHPRLARSSLFVWKRFCGLHDIE